MKKHVAIRHHLNNWRHPDKYDFALRSSLFLSVSRNKPSLTELAASWNTVTEDS
jgi:hypothetical protein